MAILRLLSEEVFDFSAEQMTHAKTETLKRQMCVEFNEVFMLCSEVLEKAQKPSLIRSTLETTLRFLGWMPIGFIFETTIIDTLLTRVRLLICLSMCEHEGLCLIQLRLSGTVFGGTRISQHNPQVSVGSGRPEYS